MKRYAELPLVEDTDHRHCWDEFGRDDELGSLNRITAQSIVDAARLVRQGKVFCLSLALDEPGHSPNFRPTYVHNVLVERNGRDDSLEGFFMSASSQWDGLRHVRYRQHGYYGGRQDEVIDETGELGIDRVAERGIVGRGVLLDVPRHMAATGEDYDPEERRLIGPELLDAILERQGVELRDGDILLLETGFLERFLARPREERASGARSSPGLDQGPAIAEWLWDHGIAAVASDNPAVEPVPLNPKAEGFLHYRLIPCLGMLLGELFSLAPLAADCAEDGVYEGLLVSSPLRVPGGVCSPANAYLVK
jgi:kynurenine formamidase